MDRNLGNVERYSSEDFHLWKFHMQVIFKGRDLLLVVNDTNLEPVVGNVD
jgi:hypothetical protein